MQRLGMMGFGMMLVAVGSYAQSPVFNRNMIVLDPAHGGADTGARINDELLEKDVNQVLVAKLRSLLAARGFTVVSTREGDAAGGTTDQRADTANKSHAVACLVIHASASASGVYLGVSAIGSPLAAIPEGSSAKAAQTSTDAVTWDRAQEAWVRQSLRLQGQIGSALARSNVPVATGRVAVKPLDNLMCPAVAVEIGTMRSGSDRTAVSDSDYQQRVAEAIAGSLVFWRNQAQPPEYVSVPRPLGVGATQ
jgi:N-acetylmuramoyl-L-alanine amidase